MKTSILILGVALILGLSPRSTCAQQAKPTPDTLGWDLSYATLLERNGVSRDGFSFSWLDERNQSPAGRLIAEWRGGTIVSSILLEFPSPEAGKAESVWFVRTRKKAHLNWLRGGRPVEQPYGSHEVSVEFYDGMLKEVRSWRQLEPRRGVEKAPKGSGGYVGFLSLSERGKSRQMLLTVEDFCLIGEKEQCLESGRVSKLLRPLFRWRS